jgi:hypothetical protein
MQTTEAYCADTPVVIYWSLEQEGKEHFVHINKVEAPDRTLTLTMEMLWAFRALIEETYSDPQRPTL